MKKLLILTIVCISLMLVVLVGCSGEANQKSEEELRAEIKAEMEAEALKAAEGQAKKEEEQKSIFQNETTHGAYINFEDYKCVIAFFYEGVNKDKLDTLEYSIGPKESFGVGTYSIQFAVFGRMENVRFDYYLSPFLDPDPIVTIGTIENALVIIDAELPQDMSHILVTGFVGGEEIEFRVDEWRMDPQVTPVENNIYKIAK